MSVVYDKYQPLQIVDINVKLPNSNSWLKERIFSILSIAEKLSN